MNDTLQCGRKVRSLHIIDDFNWEVLTIALDTNMPASRVIRELDQLIEWIGKLENIKVDNGPEFISSKLKEWTESNEINLRHLQPGKPTQNSWIERFIDITLILFKSIKEIGSFAKAWMWIYNNERPHQGLNNLTPYEFLLKHGKLYLNEIKGFPDSN
jgi:putative transposase